jgi:hypothetical protein
MTPVRPLLRAAPELVVVDLVDHALAALVLALTLEHPSIESPDDPWTSGPPTLRRAHRLAHAARRLRHDLDAYRLALHRALGVDHEPPDGLPF